MGEELGLFKTPDRARHGRLVVRRAAERRRFRRHWLRLGLVVLVVGLGVGGFRLVQGVIGLLDPPDYTGSGVGEVVVQVRDGASTRSIAATLAHHDVVASARAFVNAGAEDDRVRSVQPGYYEMRTKMSAAAAVALLLDPASRVGLLEIRAGTQLNDTRGPDGGTVPGVLSLISKATCADLNGHSTCVSADDLRAAMASADLGALGVPSWAVGPVAQAEPSRRLEGLIAPGRYDLRPGSSAADVLRTVVSASTEALTTTGLAQGAADTGLSPYQVLVVASLVEREGIVTDFPKIARVIYNRLAVPMRLQLDSTINYPLDVQTLLTSPSDRDRPGPYNTYLNLGLPPTPIGTPSGAAIAAALHPTPGPWLYFVKCQTDGSSCFSTTQAEHDAARREAQVRGVY